MLLSQRLCAVGLGLLLGSVFGAVILFTARWSLSLELPEFAWHREPPTVDTRQPRLESQDPCELHVPTIPQCDFHRAEMVVVTQVSAEQEVRLLHGLLSAAERMLSAIDASNAWNQVVTLERRRAIFPLRFGRDPRSVAGWQAISDDAARMLAEIAAGHLALGTRADRCDAAMFQATLLDLAGRTEEAERAIAGVVVEGSPMRLGLLAARLNERRSEFAERRGDPAVAREYLAASRASLKQVTAGFPRDVPETRFGIFLLAQQSESEGICLLQQIVDLMPTSPGAEVARAALLQAGALRPPEAERFRRMYIDGRGENDLWRFHALEALRRIEEADRTTTEGSR
jgi:hypothetical protein